MTKEAIIEEIHTAIGAHGKWKFRLKIAINTGTTDVSPDQVSCDDQCSFGKWLYGPTIEPEVAKGMPYIVVKRLHGEFHQIAGDVMVKAITGRTDEARTLLDGEFTIKSQNLTKALTKWKRELQ